MAVPNLKHIIEQIYNSRVWPFETKTQLCTYSHACKVAVFKANARFVELKKKPGQNHCTDPLDRAVAVDAMLSLDTGQAYDFIGDSGFAPGRNSGIRDADGNPVFNKPTWGTGDPEGKYDADDGFPPVFGDVPTDPGQPGEPGETVPPPADLTPRVAALEALHAEVNKQLGSINESIKALSKRPPATVFAHRHDVRLGGFLTIVTGEPKT